MRIRIGVAGDGPVELLAVDAFEPGQQMKPQQMAKRKSYLALPPTIDVVFLHLHLCAVSEEPFEHEGDFGGRTRLELRVKAASGKFESERRCADKRVKT
jgi:hypothetical protein